MRTPPTLDSIKKAKKLEKLIEENPPYNCDVKYTLLEAGNGFNAPKLKLISLMNFFFFFFFFEILISGIYMRIHFFSIIY